MFNTQNKDLKIKNIFHKDVELQSSLSLQILLFINVRFYLIWIIVSIYYFWTNMESILNIEYVLTIIAIIVSIPVEGLRLYLGYLGNLKEQISDLAGFWILSTFIRFPIQIYLLTTMHTFTSTFALIIQCLTLFMLILQIAIGLHTIRRFSKIGAKQFHLQRLIKQNTIVADELPLT